MLDLKIPPPIIFLCCAAFIIFLPNMVPFYEIRSNFLCLLFILFGITLDLFALIQFRRANTTIMPTTPEKSRQLVKTGVYRLSRNPMYLGMALNLIGLVWGLGNLLSFFGVLVFFCYINRFQIQPEEKVLTQLFGQDYQDYCRQTRRWL